MLLRVFSEEKSDIKEKMFEYIFEESTNNRINERKNKIEKIKEELADVVNYCVLMADACGLDLDEIVKEKIDRNNEKYPVEKSKGKSDKYDKL